MSTTRQLATAIIALSLATVLGCSSSPQDSPKRSAAVISLEQGVCPSSILRLSGKSADGRYRYGRNTSPNILNNYRRWEIANCELALGKGDTQALNVLVNHWSDYNQLAQIARTYETYSKTGRERESLHRASLFLYELYSTGAPGVPANDIGAFNHLGKAVAYGSVDLKLAYARQLSDRGLYPDAFKHYYDVANGKRDAYYRQYFSREEICESKLEVARMYFDGSGGKENWYLGYYFWQQGLTMAKGRQVGSCIADNFTQPERYSIERSRKQLVDSRLKTMSPIELQAVQTASSRGIPGVTALHFNRAIYGAVDSTPVPAPPVAMGNDRYNGSKPVQRGYTGTGGWQAWTPLSGPLCQLRASSQELSWADLFAQRAGAVWTVTSALNINKSVGSAVAVAPDTLVTNCHLVQNPHTVTLRQGDQVLNGQIRASDRDGDRCIIGIGQAVSQYVTAAKAFKVLRVGEDVSAIGNPQGLNASLSRGVVAQKRKKEEHDYIQTDTAISPGSSGGGLFDKAGNLVGITSFMVTSGQNLNFALAIDEFCKG